MRSRTGQLRDVVLIADSDVERAERLGSVCLEQGIDVVHATHGAQALELALAEVPAAMVVQVDLPLIDGERLSAILRANPRTEHLRILLIADDQVETPVDESIGRVVPGHADPETIAHFLLTLLSKQRTPRSQEEDSSPGTGGIEGDLTQVSLPELIELFHVNRKTGWIELLRRSGRQEEKGRVALLEGDLVHAETGAVQGEKALYRLFSWDRGRFAFEPDGVDSDATIERPTRALLREGRRQAAEWDRLVVDIPPDRARVALAVSRSSLPAALHPLTQEVLMVLDLTDRVRDVLDRCDFPDYQVLRTLSTMHRKGLIQLRQENASRGAGRTEALPAPLATRLRERLEPGGHRDVKVVVFAADEDAIRSFCGLVGELPGASMCEPDGPVPAVAGLGRISVEDDLGVEWLGALASPRFAPAWPLAAHGAIGVLFAHAGPVDESIQALRPAIERVSALPRARVLHGIFCGKESDSQVGALCDGLSLFDDRNVVEIPLEDPEGSTAAIRELLSRLLA
jgi:CheY-like chemotaxis protein